MLLMLRRIGVVAATLVVLASAVTWVAGRAAPAAAGPTVHGCADGAWCIYEATDFTGDMCAWQGSIRDYTQWRGAIYGRNCNDIASSYVNMGLGSFACPRVYQHAGYSAYMFTASPPWLNNGENIVPWIGASWNDKASSHSWGTC